MKTLTNQRITIYLKDITLINHLQYGFRRRRLTRPAMKVIFRISTMHLLRPVVTVSNSFFSLNADMWNEFYRSVIPYENNLVYLYNNYNLITMLCFIWIRVTFRRASNAKKREQVLIYLCLSWK